MAQGTLSVGRKKQPGEADGAWFQIESRSEARKDS